jgi:hypothetical protein
MERVFNVDKLDSRKSPALVPGDFPVPCSVSAKGAEFMGGTTNLDVENQWGNPFRKWSTCLVGPRQFQGWLFILFGMDIDEPFVDLCWIGETADLCSEEKQTFVPHWYQCPFVFSVLRVARERFGHTWNTSLQHPVADLQSASSPISYYMYLYVLIFKHKIIIVYYSVLQSLASQQLWSMPILCKAGKRGSGL